MALTAFQRDICRLIAANRKAQGESYVAGGAALNAVISAPRTSRDIDLFHDTDAALVATWEADLRLLRAGGLAVSVVRERPSFIEAMAAGEGGSTLLQWVRD